MASSVIVDVYDRLKALSNVWTLAAIVSAFLVFKRTCKAADPNRTTAERKRIEKREHLKEQDDKVERIVTSAINSRHREEQSNPSCLRLVRTPTSHDFEPTAIDFDFMEAYGDSEMVLDDWDAEDARDLEVLVHNVSHKDMLVGICNTPLASGDFSGPENRNRMPPLALARPKFSLYHAVSKKIYDFIEDRLLASQNTDLVEGKGFSSEEPMKVKSNILELRGRALRALKVMWFPESKRDPSLPNQFSDSFSTRQIPGGFDLSCARQHGHTTKMHCATASDFISIANPSGFKFRNDESTRAVLGGDLDILGIPPQSKECKGYRIAGVFFPLLAVLLPRWKAFVQDREVEHSQKQTKRENTTRKVIILVSGVGEPRNPKDRKEDNSTEMAAKLASLFIQRICPDVKVIRLHSRTNIYRYTENIGFVKFELLPLLAEFRDSQAMLWGSLWREKMRLTVSFADGSPARVAAINAALRPYKPSFMHIWQLQTFWHGRRICLDDVEILSFAEVDTYPAVSTEEVDDEEMRWVCEEMKKFRSDFEKATATEGPYYQDNPGHDLETFWMRKSRKVVLSVLLIRKGGIGKPILYRGTNMEVSMPTGSLCAERNVIGTALAQDLTLKRNDLRIIAVLSVNLSSKKTVARRRPNEIKDQSRGFLPGTPDSRLEVFSLGPPAVETNAPILKPSRSLPDLPGMLAGKGQGLTAPHNSHFHEPHSSTPPMNLAWFEESAGSAMDSVVNMKLPDLHRDESGFSAKDSDSVDTDSRREQLCHVITGSEESLSASIKSRNGSVDLQRTPQRRTTLRSLKRAMDIREAPSSSFSFFSKKDATVRKENVVLTEASDLNPLKPCGACMEWLRKIAEVNPQFAVLTFTDKDCKGVYREHVFHDSG